ncbi:hypothetical protein [Aureibaculum luteum]|uniref:hypothetical protein n=1 Tax=Aureibaculum luteum TaxID=1548456 RepID=UPI000E4A69DB|nr:hypothetical protein [Aureibaculum luteum]
MRTEENKNIETLVDKLMQDDALTTTSMQFTNSIMAQVEQLDLQKAFEYKPLISKKVWLLISFLTVSALVYIARYENLTQSKWLNYFEFDFSLNFLPNMHFSNTTLYATIIVSILFLIQIIVLKNYFNKRLNI